MADTTGDQAESPARGRRTVVARDVIGRKRQLTAKRDGRECVILAPPPGTARLVGPAAISAFIEVLREIRDEMFRNSP